MHYNPGERVRTTGIYRSLHVFHPDHDGENSLVAGDYFPRCTECLHVEYVFLRPVADAQEEKGSKSKNQSAKKSSAGS